jgi:Putative ParB-like nuclease
MAQRQQKKKKAELLGRHLVPVILGPKDRHYIVDHHHLVRALHDEGVKDVFVTVLENLSGLGADAFWCVLDNQSLTHPYDAEGRRQTYDAIPRSVGELIDDPFVGERASPGRRICQADDAVQRIPVGRFSPPTNRSRADREKLRNGRGKSAQTRQGPSGKLLARLVRASSRRVRERA